ncbi:hypothetical protein J6590_057889 [Homalodisca vitripennis]|nr:hypothetical protein J6590_057889 [Homalodisca vitripennis]
MLYKDYQGLHLCSNITSETEYSTTKHPARDALQDLSRFASLRQIASKIEYSTTKHPARDALQGLSSNITSETEYSTTKHPARDALQDLSRFASLRQIASKIEYSTTKRPARDSLRGLSRSVTFFATLLQNQSTPHRSARLAMVYEG